MKISGFLKNSFVDYPGKISAVIFTQGCNMRCSYCHNTKLLSVESEYESISTETILEFLKTRKGFLDGVVITGGEPTLWPEINSLIKSIKNLGFKVKLDTNGTNPKVIKELVDGSLIDYIAMDVKGTIEKYNYICGADVNVISIKESIEFLLEDKVDYEFRTTFAPEINPEDLLEISKLIKGAKRYVIQQYKEIDRETGMYTGVLEKRNVEEELYHLIKNNVKNLQVRGEITLI